MVTDSPGIPPTSLMAGALCIYYVLFCYVENLMKLLSPSFLPLHVQDVFGYKIELSLAQYIMAILDYVSADILKVCPPDRKAWPFLSSE